MLNILAVVVAILIIVIILQDAFETIILPRRVSRKFRLARLFFKNTWLIWSRIARILRPQRRREYFLSFYGPLSLIFLLALWAIGLIMGFALLQWGLSSPVQAPEKTVTFGTYVYLSGTTFFTLGLGDVIPKAGLARFLTVLEAGTGFGFLALVIGYLPVIYQAFSKREVGISLMDAHAGSPPTALELLRRHQHGDIMDELVEHLHTWENWSADILESHLSYPVLMYYRSQHDRQSWLAALTAILDASALLAVGIDDVPRKSAWFTFAIASHAAVDLGQVFAQPYTASKDRLPHEDFVRLQQLLTAMGIALHEPETAEARLAELRSRYEPYIMGLSEHLMMPLPEWLPVAEHIDDWQTSAWDHDLARKKAHPRKHPDVVQS